MKYLLLVAVACVLVQAVDRAYNQTQYWFEEQLVDHADPTNQAVWSQRYWAVENFFNPENGSVLLYICGEYTCPGVNPDRLFVIDLAKRYNSLIVVLEHRYYGNSMPFGDQSLTLENLRHLNVHNALDDLAYFLGWIRSTGRFRVTKQNPWYTVGGSYPGALSAWFRFKYPHLTVGALASSAVVFSKTNFPEFDQQIYTSTQKSSDACSKAIQAATAKAEEFLSKQDLSAAFKKQFLSENLSDPEFFFMLADVYVELVQYGKRTWLCENVVGKDAADILTWTAQYVQENVDVRAYGSYYMSNTTYDVNNVGSRQWTYQTCSEVGWLQTAPQNNSMRSQQVTIDFYKQWCKDSFGTDLWPKSDVFNTYFGGQDLDVPGLIMTNGDEDPWKHASVIKGSARFNKRVYEIQCDNCAHCVELYTPSEKDSKTLKFARTMIVGLFDKWIGDHWRQIKIVQE